jgi:hypothetical protein
MQVKAESPPEHLKVLQQQLNSLTDKELEYDKQYINQIMGWAAPEPAPANGGAASPAVTNGNVLPRTVKC